MHDSDHSFSMVLDDPWQSRWSYAISDSRSELIPAQGPSQQIPSPSAPSPPPQSTHSPLTEIKPGVWLNDGYTLYSSDWPPVQEYLNEIRELRYLVDAPSDIILALAALDVINTPTDSAHWLLFSRGDRTDTTLGVVDKVASERPRLIKTSPWLGITHAKYSLTSSQMKFDYTYIRRQWYPVEGVPQEPRKMTTRSSGDVPDVLPTVTPEEFFNLLKPAEIPKPVKKNKKSKAKANSRDSPVEAREPVPESSSSTTPPIEKVLPVAPQITTPSASASPPRLSTRVRRKVTPTSRSPRILSIPTDTAPPSTTPSPAGLSTAPMSSPTLSAASSSHSRSTSQSSIETIVESTRSVSVLSNDTVVETSPSKKRKADNDLEKVDDINDEQERALSGTERMVTRGRASKKTRSIGFEKGSDSSRMSTPAIETVIKPVPCRTRVKKVRV